MLVTDGAYREDGTFVPLSFHYLESLAEGGSPGNPSSSNSISLRYFRDEKANSYSSCVSNAVNSVSPRERRSTRDRPPGRVDSNGLQSTRGYRRILRVDQRSWRPPPRR